MSSLLRMQMLLMAQVKAAGATFVDSANALVSHSTDAPNQTITVALPAGVTDGDAALLSINSGYSTLSATLTVTAPSGSAALVPVTNYASGSWYEFYAVYLYKLSAADVAAGSIAVGVSRAANVTSTCQMTAWRGVSANVADAVGAVGEGVGPDPWTITAPRVTTVNANDVIVYLAVTNIPPVYGVPVFTPPSDFAYANSSTTGPYQFAAYKTVGAPGEVPAASGTFTCGAPGDADWAAVLVALRPTVPAITLAIDLPTATVGMAYTGSITATNTDGAAGAITITATPLPDGLSTSPITDNGDGSYTLPITGTPATAQSVDVGISATNGTQTSATTHTLAVTSMAAVPVVQAKSVNGNSVKSSTFDASVGWAAPKAGNLLIAALVASSSGATAPAGWSAKLTSTSATRNILVYWRVANGTESSVTFTAFGAHLLEIASTASTPFNGAIQETFSSSNTFVVGPLTPTAPNCLAFGAAAWNITTQNNFSADAGWTLITEGEGKSFSSALAYKLLDDSLSASQVAISGAVQTSGGGTFVLLNMS